MFWKGAFLPIFVETLQHGVFSAVQNATYYFSLFSSSAEPIIFITFNHQSPLSSLSNDAKIAEIECVLEKCIFRHSRRNITTWWLQRGLGCHLLFHTFLIICTIYPFYHNRLLISTIFSIESCRNSWNWPCFGKVHFSPFASNPFPPSANRCPECLLLFLIFLIIRTTWSFCCTWSSISTLFSIQPSKNH